MIKELSGLSSEEQELILRAPFLTCILIAGADDEIDRKEINKAIVIANKKVSKARPSLRAFYKEVSLDFEDKIKILIQGYPHAAKKRNEMVINELSQLNLIWKKINHSFATDLFHSLKEIAQLIAESSGGVLGIKSVGDEEEYYVDLPMINEPGKN
ncbi:MAG: hypothetical protein HC811_02110 [Flammeovirgaceae bacterium]|nr:hypothetical protein [Flammeovirgaceae bacterium]